MPHPSGVSRGRTTFLALTIALVLLAVLAGAAVGAQPPIGGFTSTARPGLSSGAPDATPTPQATASLTGPATTASAVPGGGDLRSSGQGAGAAGNPMGAVWAFFVVLGIGLVAAAGTGIYVRATAAKAHAARQDSPRSSDSRDNA